MASLVSQITNVSTSTLVGIGGGFLGYWFEDTIFGTTRNRKILAVFIGATCAVGTSYVLQNKLGVALVDLK